MQNFSAHKASCDKSKTYSHGDDLVVLENGSSQVGEMTHLQIEHLKFSNVFKMSCISLLCLNFGCSLCQEMWELWLNQIRFITKETVSASDSQLMEMKS